MNNPPPLHLVSSLRCAPRHGTLWLQESDERAAFVAELHKLKTNIFMEMVEAGQMPLRPGVKRLVGVAL